MSHPTVRPLLMALFLGTCTVGAWAQAPPIVGAQIQAAHYDPQTKAITIRIVNTSQEEITAYGISVTCTYAKRSTLVDGTSDTAEIGRDLFDASGLLNLPKFNPGTSHDEVYRNAPGVSVTNCTAAMSTVIYADQTAEVQNEATFGSIVATRKGRILARQKVNEIVNQALADPSVKDPAREAATEIKRLADVLNGRQNIPSTNPDSWVKIYLNMANDEIRRNPKPEHLKEIVKSGEDEITALTPHTLVKKGVPQ